MPGDLMTAKAAMAKLGLGGRAFHRFVKAGIIPVFVDPTTGRKRYPRQAIDERMRRFADEQSEQVAS